MTVLAIFTGNGITKQMYEALQKEIAWESRHPAGAIFHAASLDDAGNIHVADVWESAESLDAFVNSRLMPAMEKLRVPPPSVTVYPAFHINAYAAVEKFVLR